MRYIISVFVLIFLFVASPVKAQHFEEDPTDPTCGRPENTQWSLYVTWLVEAVDLETGEDYYDIETSEINLDEMSWECELGPDTPIEGRASRHAAKLVCKSGEVSVTLTTVVDTCDGFFQDAEQRKSIVLTDGDKRVKITVIGGYPS